MSVCATMSSEIGIQENMVSDLRVSLTVQEVFLLELVLHVSFKKRLFIFFQVDLEKLSCISFKVTYSYRLLVFYSRHGFSLISFPAQAQNCFGFENGFFITFWLIFVQSLLSINENSKCFLLL